MKREREDIFDLEVLQRSFRMNWAVMPPLHSVYRKDLISQKGPPTVVITKYKDVKYPFDNLQVVAILKNYEDAWEPSKKHLQEMFFDSKPFCHCSKTTFEFKKLKILKTSQQNKGKNFQLVLQLFAEQGGVRFSLGTLMSPQMNTYSHKNLVPHIDSKENIKHHT